MMNEWNEWLDAVNEAVDEFAAEWEALEAEAEVEEWLKLFDGSLVY